MTAVTCPDQRTSSLSVKRTRRLTGMTTHRLHATNYAPVYLSSSCSLLSMFITMVLMCEIKQINWNVLKMLSDRFISVLACLRVGCNMRIGNFFKGLKPWIQITRTISHCRSWWTWFSSDFICGRGAEEGWLVQGERLQRVRQRQDITGQITAWHPTPRVSMCLYLSASTRLFDYRMRFQICSKTRFRFSEEITFT